MRLLCGFARGYSIVKINEAAKSQQLSVFAYVSAPSAGVRIP
jgi:hypothetical protein